MEDLDRKRKLDAVKKALPLSIRRILEDTIPKVEEWEDPFQDTWEKGLSRVAAEMKSIERSRVIREALRKTGRSSDSDHQSSQRSGYSMQRRTGTSKFSQNSGKTFSQGRVKFKGRKSFLFRSNSNSGFGGNTRHAFRQRQENRPARDGDGADRGAAQDARRGETPRCYRCGQLGHIAPNCPNPPASNGASSKGGGRGGGKSRTSGGRGRGTGGKSN